MSIDWKRIAKPQPDGYDSEVIASLLYEKYGWKKIAPSTELTLCNGAVGITEDKLVLTEADLQCGLNLTGWDTKNPLVQVTPAEASAIYLIGNIPKVQDGLVEIRNHAKLTPAGVAFMDGYLEWGEDLVSRALPFLKEALGDKFDTEYARALDYRSRRLLELQANEDAKRADQAAVTP